ncbi:DMT family transporter [Labrys wisconsinensis]|uniref:Drug/metabolite transporter (DMT)-like permease n=1 Tax=Labrys wisconsinensis TaxID=425677 RepID=A0ABU0JDU0_9HYPH|nr:DMT family transporter [Labrys wisconsinensis]MDQ0472452.1 drug/metabolite transporter (DMT)-like permease [Labrys wisconsinensis]
MASANTAFWGAGLALTAGAMFSFGGITVRLSPHLDAFQYLLWRSFGLVPLVFAIALWRRSSPLRQMRDSGWHGVAGGLTLTGAALCFIFAMKTTTVANALLFATSAPLIGALLARLLLRERVGTVTWTAIGIGAVGLLVMTGSEVGSGNFAGNLAAVGSAFAYALYSVVARLGRGRDMSGSVADYALLTALATGLIVWVDGSPFWTPPFENAMAMLHGALFIGVGMILFNIAARSVPANRLTLLAQTEMLLGPVWVFLIFDERPRPATLLGGLIVLAGVMLSAWGGARSRSAPVADDVPHHRREHDRAADDRRPARVLGE